MIKKIALFVLISILIVLILSYQTKNKIASNVITIGSTKININIADNDIKRQKGLSGVANLDANSGMLFTFPQKQIIPTFWMKDMLIPLDFIWISENKVAQIDENIQPPSPGVPNSTLKLYSPVSPIDYVLEVNAGFAKKHNIKVGDTAQMQSGLVPGF